MSRVWAEFPSHVQLPSGPFWPLGLLVLGPGIYALDNMLVTCIFGPNSPANLSNNHPLLTFIPSDA